MRRSLPRFSFTCVLVLALHAAQLAGATDFDRIGLSPLRREAPSLIGTGIPVGQTEGEEAANSGRWEVNPDYPTVLQPTSLFTWISSAGTATTFPNAVGVESVHASVVGGIFYGTSAEGVAPGVLHVRSYDAVDYINDIITPTIPQPDMVVNQSWIAGINSEIDDDFDKYSALYNVLFVSGMNNAPDTPQSPGSCYNGIGVGRGETVGSSIGPTANGRAKPDISVAPDSATSFLTPVVAGAATLLLQAAAQNDGGPATAVVATNSSVIKALLLNGAVKQASWTNGPTRPLDARFGAGAVNIYNSWLQLRGGRATVNVTNAASRGWDYNSLSSSVFDQTNRYSFNVSTNGGSYVANVTLVWKRSVTLAMANFDLHLFDSNNQAIASSVSTVDNVEHLFATNLPPGRYDVRVVRRAGVAPTASPNYALAFDFSSTRLQIARSATNIVVSWPVNEAGVALQSTPNLNAPFQWDNVTANPFVTNAMNTVTLPATNGMSFFRLARP